MSRWKAAAIHLSISAAIGLVVGALLLLVWYPPPYFHAAGADQLVLLLVGVDLVLGPLLTLILFRSGKKGLKFDLAMIAVLQTTALVYGLSVVLQSRPVFLVSAVAGGFAQNGRRRCVSAWPSVRGKGAAMSCIPAAAPGGSRMLV